MVKADDMIKTVGRRKEAVARVRLSKGSSGLVVNGRPIHEYFSGLVMQKMYQRPFQLTNIWSQYSGTIKVVGGGTASQLGAVLHGLSRAIAKLDTEKKLILKKNGLLTRDARVKERRKYGLAHKARAKKQSPKR